MNEHNFQVGDFITAYHQGFHVITAIKRRFKTSTDYVIEGDDNCENAGEEINPLVEYKTIRKHGNIK